MVSRLQKESVLTYVPGVTAVPAKPAYCYTRQVVTSYKEADTVVRFVPLSDGVIPSGAVPVYRGDGIYGTVLVGYSVTEYSNGASIGSYGGSPLVPVYTDFTECVPETVGVAGVPPSIVRAANNGWDTGGRSTLPVPEGAYIKVDIPADPIGILIGLTDGQFSHAYSDAKFAMVARPGGITPVEGGQAVGYQQPLTASILLARSGGMVRMILDGKIVYSTPSGELGRTYAVSMLYASSDHIVDPIIGAYHESSALVELESESFIDHRNGSVSLFTVETEAVV